MKRVMMLCVCQCVRTSAHRLLVCRTLFPKAIAVADFFSKSLSMFMSSNIFQAVWNWA